MATSTVTEGFQPPAHWAPTTPGRRALFQLRLLLDLQMAGIRRDVRAALAGFRGALLDVGCGNSPYRHLLDPATSTYQGVDVAVAADFGYQNPDTVYYDGRVLPFPDASFDAVLCTEVLEHILDPGETIREMHRVLKPGGLLIVTTPWSARFHYQPHDYHRYTPTMLAALFAAFPVVDVRPRGTDVSAIASKVIVVWARNLFALRSVQSAAALLAWPLRALLAVLLLPMLAAAAVLGQASLLWNLGSADDPLGYTLLARK